MTTKFSNLEIHDWRQFSRVNIDFHPRLTVLTGANGAGKTTLLNMLGRHFGWLIAMVATAMPTEKGAFRYFSGIADSNMTPNLDGHRPRHTIGTIGYDDNQTATVFVEDVVAESFDVVVVNQQTVD